jgi:hypothetical protein
MTNYFTNMKTPAQVKMTFRDLAMKNHPDKGGDTAVMQEINNQYHETLKSLNGWKATSEAKWSYTYSYAKEQAVVDMLQKISHLPVDIEVKGNWIWVSGDTKPVKDYLKELKFRWARGKKQWYWHDPQDGWKRSSKRRYSSTEISMMFGCETVENDDTKGLN